MKLEKDTTVSHYKILKIIGKGGMGEVYLAEDTKLDRQVAIKFLSAEFSQDVEKLHRFIQEAKAASALNHPNILTVYEIGEYEGNNYIVTEFIAGKPLNEVLKKEPLETEKAINFAIEITSALATAHDAGIIHRDIKAHNIMIRKDGIVKLLDFGLAKLTHYSVSDIPDHEAETIARVNTLPGTLMGTPTYMSPEQVRGKVLDARTDIFSFGILFFEMLTGKRPFDGESFADVMGAILKDEPPPLSRFIENVPPELNHIVEKTLRKDREQRYQSVKDLVIDLKDLRDLLKFEAKLIHSTNSTKPNLVHSTDAATAVQTVHLTNADMRLRQSKVLPIIIISLILAVVAGGVWWMLPGKKDQTAVSAPVSFEKKDITSWNSAPGELFSTGSFSPDNKMIAFSSAQSGSKNIWIKQTSSGEAIQVTKDSFNNQNPIWSPNGNEIAFFSERGNLAGSKGTATGIWRIPTLGGTPVSIAPVQDGGSQLRLWSKSEKIYYESNKNLFAADIESGKTEQITKFSPNDAQIKFIGISADEKRIAFVQKDGKIWKIMTSAIAGDNPQQIVSVENEISSVVWHPDNERLFYSQSVDGAFQVFAVSADGGEPTKLTNAESDNVAIDVSADGSNILIASAREESDLWDANTATSEENIVASGIDSQLWADASPDRQTIAFQSVKNLSQGNNLLNGSILVKNSGTNAQPLMIAENAFLPKWSPDGQQLAFMRFEGSKPQTWIVNADGGQEKKLTDGEIPAIGYSVSPYNRIQTTNFSWSPDGKTIAYLLNREGISNIRQVSTDGSADVQITNNNDEKLLLNCPIWSDDGSRIAFYFKSTKLNEEGKQINGLQITDINSTETHTIFETSSTLRLIGWNSSGNGLIFASPSKVTGLPPEVELSEVEIETGKQHSVALLKSVYYYNIFLSQDKKTIAYVARQDSKDNIWLTNSDGKKARKITNNNDPNLYFSSLSWSPDGNAVYYGKQSRYSLLSMLVNYK